MTIHAKFHGGGAFRVCRQTHNMGQHKQIINTRVRTNRAFSTPGIHFVFPIPGLTLCLLTVRVRPMQIGNVVEYIDRQKIMCGVVLEAKNQRLRLLTENNREVKLPAGRLIHSNGACLDMSMGRDRLVQALKEIVQRRNALRENVDLKELWEVLNTEQEWIDLDTMTVFCFPDNPTKDHESAVIRAFFRNRRYFRFNPDGFFPNSQDVVDNIIAREKKEARIARMVEDSGQWINQALSRSISEITPEMEPFIEILKSYYLFETESPHVQVARQIMAAGGIGDLDQIFKVLVNLGVWAENENLDLLRYEVPVEFSQKVLESAQGLVTARAGEALESHRVDLTHLSIITVDSQSTMDFDDAISVEHEADHVRVGVHISDVGHYIPKDSPLDKEAKVRASSIYTPDMKIPMLPPQLAEGLLSLRQGEIKRAISLLVKMTPVGQIMSFEIVPSIIRVTRQLSYYDVNTMMDSDPDIKDPGGDRPKIPSMAAVRGGGSHHLAGNRHFHGI